MSFKSERGTIRYAQVTPTLRVVVYRGHTDEEYSWAVSTDGKRWVETTKDALRNVFVRCRAARAARAA